MNNIFNNTQQNAASFMNKSKAAQKVLRLMDEDILYVEALYMVLDEDKSLNKEELEKEIDLYV